MIQDLPIPTGSDQYAIAAVVIVALAGLELSKTVFARYIVPKTDAPAARERDREAEDLARDRERAVRTAAHVHELREWHKPGPDGRQSWKNTEVVEILRDIRDALRDKRPGG